MGGSHRDRSNTHCDVITITESYHLLHHSWLIQYRAKKKRKKSRLLRLNMIEGTRINPLCQRQAYFPFLRPKTLTPNARAHLLDSITSSCTKSARDYVPKDAHFSSSPAKSQKKSLSFEQCTFSYLKKERKSISGFNMRGQESILPAFGFFLRLLSLSWPVNRNNGIWLWQGQGWLSW